MKRILSTIYILFLLSANLFSQTINLEDVRALTLANSRELTQLNLSVRTSVLNERSHLFTMFPNLSAEYGIGMNFLEKDWKFVNPVDTLNASGEITITQKIFEGGKSFIRKSINSINTEKARLQLLARYFSVLSSADEAYYAVLESRARLEAAESSLESMLSNLAIAEIRQASGMINQGDYLKALADKEAQENSRNQARRSLQLNVTKLKSLIGLTENFELESIDLGDYEDLLQRLALISDEEAALLFVECITILVQTNPSFAQSTLSRQIAEKEYTIAKLDYSPTISARIDIPLFAYTRDDGFYYPNSTSGRVSLTGKIPLDFWVLTNNLEKSKNSRDSAVLDFMSAENDLEINLQSALIDIFNQSESVLSSRRSLEYAQKHYDYVAERYRLSQSSVSDLGDAASLLINSRNNLISSQFGFLRNLTALRSLGAFDEEETLINILMGI